MILRVLSMSSPRRVGSLRGVAPAPLSPAPLPPFALALPLQGPPGPPGPPGASGAGYVHTQVDPLFVWTIAHNLGFRPAVQVTDLTGSVVDGEIVHLSANEVRCLFAIAIAGTARLV